MVISHLVLISVAEARDSRESQPFFSSASFQHSLSFRIIGDGNLFINSNFGITNWMMFVAVQHALFVQLLVGEGARAVWAWLLTFADATTTINLNIVRENINSRGSSFGFVDWAQRQRERERERKLAFRMCAQLYS